MSSPDRLESGYRRALLEDRPESTPTSAAVRLRVREVELFERAVTLRLPFRFGAATVTHCPQAFVRVRVEIGGQSFIGATAELMVPKWFDKSPALSHEDNFEQLRQSLRHARHAWLDANEPCTPWAGSDRYGQAAIDHGVAQGLPPLAAKFGAAQLDKALADAALRASGLGWCDGVRVGVLGDPWSPRLAVQRPVSVALRHTVGLADRLSDADAGAGAGDDPDDGLPATLQAVIAAYGVRFFKLKLCGDIAADLARLAAIATVLDSSAGDYRVTLDGNETFVDTASLGHHWQELCASPALEGLLQRTLLLEQPLARAVALQQSIAGLGITVPVILDESDDHAQAFDKGIALGYRGVSSKACKGLYRSLHNAALIAEHPTQGLLLSGEDLTCQAGLAVQQDTLLAASLGVAHIERNGHHYVDGFGLAPAGEAAAFAEAHAGFYHRDASGRVRLAVQAGRLDLRSLHGPGFAHAAEPDWASLQPFH